MARVGSVRRRKLKSTHDTAEFGDRVLIDFPQGFQRQAPEVEVGSSLGPVLKAFRFVRPERLQSVVHQNIVFSGGHSKHVLIIGENGLESRIPQMKRRAAITRGMPAKSGSIRTSRHPAR